MCSRSLILRSRAVAWLSGLALAATSLTAQQTPPVPQPATPAPPARAVAPVDVDRVVAVVGDQAILYSEFLDEVNMRRASGMQIPTEPIERAKFDSTVLDDMVESELLVQRARAEKVEVSDDELAKQVDQQIRQIRSQFPNENEFRTALRREGFGTPEEYRRRQIELLRRRQLQSELIQKLRRDGKLAPSPVSEAELTEAYERSKATLPKREATIGFKQVVVAPKPTPAAKAAARAKAESLLVEIAKGGDFEQIAKRESMDPASKELGGDLGWNRRGKMLTAFDDVMFAIPPGRVSPIVETTYGFHIIRVDRVQPAERKARHILIRPKIDSNDVARAKLEADSVRQALDKGADLDSLIARHHDPVENSLLPEFQKAQLPPSYAQAIGDSATGALVGPFAIEDPANNAQKYVVLRVTMSVPAGDYPEAEVRLRLREQVSEGKTIRKLVDNLKKATYVSTRLGPTTTAVAPRSVP